MNLSFHVIIFIYINLRHLSKKLLMYKANGTRSGELFLSRNPLRDV